MNFVKSCGHAFLLRIPALRERGPTKISGLARGAVESSTGARALK